MTEEEIKQKIDILFNRDNSVLDKEGTLQFVMGIYFQLQSQLTEKDSVIERLKLNEQLAINNGKVWLNQLTEKEKQIEKMKCCQNCEHHFYNGLHYICCDINDIKGEPIIVSLINCPNWQLKE